MSAWANQLSNQYAVLTYIKMKITSYRTDLYQKLVVNAVYKEYRLEYFENNGNNHITNPNNAIKLISLIFLNHGTLPCCKFLLPFIRNCEVELLPNCQTIVNDYASSNHADPVYKLIEIQNNRNYVFSVSVGNLSAAGVGPDQESAKVDAAKNFILTYQIHQTQKKLSKQIKDQNIQISEQRKNEIYYSLKSFNLNNKHITDSQMDEVLTDISYDQPNKPDNACISIVGENVVDMICYQFLIKNRKEETFDLNIEKNTILKNNNIDRRVPDKGILYLLRSTEDNEKKSRKIKMKRDVFESIAGFLWINHLSNKDAEIFDVLKNFITHTLAIEEKTITGDYGTFLQNIVQKKQWKISGSATTKHKNGILSVAMSVSGPGWKEYGVGSGLSEIVANNDAAKDVLQKLLLHCSGDSDTSTAIRDKLDGIKPVGGPSASKPEISFDRSENILYICKGTIACERKHHKITSVTGILASSTGRSVKINVNYCSSCKLYFINETTYNDYRAKFGIIMGNFSFRDYEPSNGLDPKGWAPKSILNICGYTVGQAADLSVNGRRFILENIMVRNILPKYRVEEYLEFFIRLNWKNNPLAVQKWESDLKWVRNYNLDKQRHVWLDKIKKFP